MATQVIEWVNADRLMRLLAQGGPRAVDATARALYEEALDVFRVSQEQVPVDMGVLRGSGQVHQPAIAGGEIVVEITYGGAAKGYAAIQHENMEFTHAPGRKAKYLEDPVVDAVPGMDRNIALRVEAILRGLI